MDRKFKGRGGGKLFHFQVKIVLTLPAEQERGEDCKCKSEMVFGTTQSSCGSCDLTMSLLLVLKAVDRETMIFFSLSHVSDSISVN